MAIKLDDFLSKKKEPAQVLDLSKVKITTKEEFRKYYDKIPEYKIKPEKVMPETIKIRDKDFSFFPSRREEKQIQEWSYPDPTPPDMKAVKLEDLCPVNIDWKMLTTLRPKTKVEEDMFSRLVQLGKLDLKYQQMLKREKDSDWIRRTKNPRSSIVETRVLSCKECAEDLCDGTLCNLLMYENFFRIQPSVSTGVVKDGAGIDTGDETGKKKKKKKKKRRSRKRTRSRVRRKPRKNSIFNRPASRGCSKDHSRRGSHANIQEKIRAQSAIRAASLSRSRSQERRPSVAEGAELRAKSAPRIQFKGTDEVMPMYSDSGPTATDFSSQSESESPSYQHKASRLKLPGRRRSRSRSVAFSDGCHSDSETPGRGKFRRECTLDHKGFYSDVSGDSQDSEAESRSTSLSPDKGQGSKTKTKQPSTIDIEFDELAQAANTYFHARSYQPSRIAGVTKKCELPSYSSLRNQEVTRLMEGFSKIELGFNEPDPGPSTSNQGRRGPKIRPKTNQPPPMKPPTSATVLKGKALLSKPQQ